MMENNNEMSLDNEGRRYSEKWLKIATYVGLVGALASIAPECVGPKVEDDLAAILEKISYIGDVLFTAIEVILLLLITRKMKFDGIEKPSPLFIYGLIICSVLSTLGWLFYWADMIGLLYIAGLLFLGWKFLSNQRTKMIGISMLLLPVGAFITVLIALYSGNHNKLIILLTLLPYYAAAKFYLDACTRFLTDRNWESKNK